MIKKISAFLIVFLFVFLTGCQNDLQTETLCSTLDTNITEVDVASDGYCEPYSIKMINGKQYLCFDDNQKNPQMNQLADISFDSVDEMLYAIRNNKFEEWQYNVIRSAFPSDENGILIFDLNHVYDAKAPDGFRVLGVTWNGPAYSFCLENEAEEFVYLHWLQPESFQTVFDSYYTSLLESERITITKQEDDEERNAVIYWFETKVASIKLIRYVLPSGVLVQEEYILSLSIDFISPTPSQSIPSRIQLFDANENASFYASIGGLSERPSVEWLSQIGLVERQSN